MRTFWLACVLAVAPAISFADDPAPAPTTKATFLVTGLHCPPCTRTVQSSLQRTKGVRSVNVDWRTKNATIEFDETQLSAAGLAQRIAGTAHMMGGNMRYSGWLALHVDGMGDAKKAEDAKAALMKVPGVAQVAVYPAQNSVGIRFDAAGKATSGELIKALEVAGLTAGNLK